MGFVSEIVLLSMTHRISICFFFSLSLFDDSAPNTAQIVNKLCEFSTNDHVITKSKLEHLGKNRNMHIFCVMTLRVF